MCQIDVFIIKFIGIEMTTIGWIFKSNLWWSLYLYFIMFIDNDTKFYK